MNGNATTNNLFLVDGANNNDVGSNRTILIYPSIEAISEFKMLRNSYGPEYGQASGAVINIVTRSGSNQWHGDVLYFGRNDALNAEEWFAARRHRSVARSRPAEPRICQQWKERVAAQRLRLLHRRTDQEGQAVRLLEPGVEQGSPRYYPHVVRAFSGRACRQFHNPRLRRAIAIGCELRSKTDPTCVAGSLRQEPERSRDRDLVAGLRERIQLRPIVLPSA